MQNFQELGGPCFCSLKSIILACGSMLRSFFFLAIAMSSFVVARRWSLGLGISGTYPKRASHKVCPQWTIPWPKPHGGTRLLGTFCLGEAR